MDLAPKPLQSQDASILKSTAESRLKNFMQDVTGRACDDGKCDSRTTWNRNGSGSGSFYFFA